MSRYLPIASTLSSDVKEQTAPTIRRLPALVTELDHLAILSLAAGKDFNDELTFILNHAETALNLVGPNHPARESLVELTHASMRCAETARCLLVLAGRARHTLPRKPRFS